MEKNIKKELLIAAAISIVLIIIVYILAVSLPLKEQTLPENDMNISESTKLACVNLCETYKEEVDFSEGPCLSDIYEFETEDWVCDIASNPRTEADDKAENQCVMYRKELAHHFVEVDKDCNFIRAE
jgi:hypothetical protein